MATKHPRPKPLTPDQAKIAELTIRLSAMQDRAFQAEDRIKSMITRERFKEALIEMSEGCRADGWKAGVADALIPQSPDHGKALAYVAGLSAP